MFQPRRQASAAPHPVPAADGASPRPAHANRGNCHSEGIARGASVLGMRPVELRRSAGLWGARPCLTPRLSQFYGAGERLWERAAEVSGLPAGVSTLQAPHSGARSAHRSAVASGPTRLGRGGPALLLSRDAPWGLQPLETHRRLAPLSVLLPRVSGPSPLSLNLHPVVPGAVTQAPICSPSP